MNFNDMRMSIQLDRSYLEEALAVDPTFSTPHFITLLIEHGYLKDDGILPMLRKPIFIKADNVDLLTDVINGTSRYRLLLCISPKHTTVKIRWIFGNYLEG